MPPIWFLPMPGVYLCSGLSMAISRTIRGFGRRRKSNEGRDMVFFRIDSVDDLFCRAGFSDLSISRNISLAGGASRKSDKPHRFVDCLDILGI